METLKKLVQSPLVRRLVALGVSAAALFAHRKLGLEVGNADIDLAVDGIIVGLTAAVLELSAQKQAAKAGEAAAAKVTDAAAAKAILTEEPKQ